MRRSLHPSTKTPLLASSRTERPWEEEEEEEGSSKSKIFSW
jgi:hypothetical protein